MLSYVIIWGIKLHSNYGVSVKIVIKKVNELQSIHIQIDGLIAQKYEYNTN